MEEYIYVATLCMYYVLYMANHIIDFCTSIYIHNVFIQLCVRVCLCVSVCLCICVSVCVCICVVCLRPLTKSTKVATYVECIMQ